MPRHHPPRRQRSEAIERIQPAEQAAIERRAALHEHQITGPQDAAGRIVHGQIGVGMGGRPGGERQRPAAQIELQPVFDQEVGRHHLARLARHADLGARLLQIEVAALGQRLGQLGMADEARPVRQEGGLPEHMVGMDMGRDDIAHRPVGARAERLMQGRPRGGAAAVDHGDRLLADHEAAIGNRAEIVGIGQLMHALMGEHAGRQLDHVQLGLGCCRHLAPAGRDRRRQQQRLAPRQRRPPARPTGIGSSHGPCCRPGRPPCRCPWRRS